MNNNELIINGTVVEQENKWPVSVLDSLLSKEKL